MEHLAAVILAAGRGKRLGGKRQKVMRTLLGKSILCYSLGTVRKLNPDRIIIVIGFHRSEVLRDLRGEPVEYARQPRPAGTGDAVRKTSRLLHRYAGDILVLCGDVPFLTERTLRRLIAVHRTRKSLCTILTARVSDPTGYGRIRRDSGRRVVEIVEEVNASEREKRIREVNAGVYVFRSPDIFSALRRVRPDPVKGEYYLTEVVRIFASSGAKIATYRTSTPEEALGINTLRDLKHAQEYLRARRGGRWTTA